MNVEARQLGHGDLEANAASLTIEPVRSRRSLQEFIALPRRLYAGQPGFVAPLDHERRHFLDPKKSPFFAHGRARYWIARRGVEPVGRISAQIDSAAEGVAHAGIGAFGCLDTIDDGNVVAALLRTAEAWLRDHGRRLSRGPFLLSINGEAGLLVEGHAEPAMTMMPWHPPFLAQHLENAGYRPVQGLSAYALDVAAHRYDDGVAAIEKIRRPERIGIRGLNVRDFRAEAEIIRTLFNDAWQDNWGFVPLTEADIDAFAKNLKPLLKPESGVIAEHAGEPVGFLLTVPNTFEITSDLGGAPSLLGWIKLLLRLRRHRYRSCRVILMGVARKYQRSALGAEAATAMMKEIIARMRTWGMLRIEAGWILESNQPMLRILDRFGYARTRRFCIYERAI